MRPSGSQSIENGSPSTRAMTSRLPSLPNASTSPASQSHIQKRPPCHRGDSPILIPAAKISATRHHTAFDVKSLETTWAAPEPADTVGLRGDREFADAVVGDDGVQFSW